MERGENTANLPRKVAHLAERQVRDHHNNSVFSPRWKGTEDTLFRVAEADMSKVKVATARRRKTK
ncbi:hypothetical protein A2837_03410 [Candidatus Kaiserbacteria bacterium RIFCSPHIGHO2_01_FULL_46_22]|uniref:Uncharacterized protein n=1 Tax=Candidatus Kaiserbacteria bacterium RIFCSPHIGHO2_01_FULL_46_22 TaxID=1798475 RepID=A0A1F6BXN8_9BACT|nr:MAG: hypothetical protein A2837_03410 [Candidatus Kaiserbacteria bacterium RIFCSPHIGHO2_01_FULL_46_22]